MISSGLLQPLQVIQSWALLHFYDVSYCVILEFNSANKTTSHQVGAPSVCLILSYSVGNEHFSFRRKCIDFFGSDVYVTWCQRDALCLGCEEVWWASADWIMWKDHYTDKQTDRNPCGSARMFALCRLEFEDLSNVFKEQCKKQNNESCLAFAYHWQLLSAWKPLIWIPVGILVMDWWQLIKHWFLKAMGLFNTAEEHLCAVSFLFQADT